MPQRDPDAIQPAEAERYVVYLSGIGKASGRWSFPEEVDFIARLKAELPDTVVIDDVFPYGTTFRGLEEERFFNVLWGFVNTRLLRRPTATVGWLVNIRNLFQVAVSVDHRYGPFYNLGAAESVIEALQAHGYRVGSGRPVVMIGYSGGAQVSLGAATYLAQMLAAPIHLVSIGGVISADPGCVLGPAHPLSVRRGRRHGRDRQDRVRRTLAHDEAVAMEQDPGRREGHLHADGADGPQRAAGLLQLGAAPGWAATRGGDGQRRAPGHPRRIGEAALTRPGRRKRAASSSRSRR